RLLAEGHRVYGVDNLNTYYDVQLKRDRLKQLQGCPNFTFERLDLADRDATARLFRSNSFNSVVHLAAQGGVRYSIENPYAYSDSNLVGFLHVLEGCRHSQIQHLLFASSSSVYGANRKVPFAVEDNVDYPVSLYAATKKANELMAHAYSHLYQIPMTGLRFFTVYGPWGRPDMAYFKFVDAIAKGRPIQVYNHGQMRRDFTYVDDVVEGILRLMPTPPTLETTQTGDSQSNALYKIYNIGNHSPVTLLDFIQVIEQAMGKKAEKIMLPMQPGDVPSTYADVEALMRDAGFQPSTPIAVGIQRFVDWYQGYYAIAQTG
ncbi:capsular biosynthesis protein CpsI, partial [filamentous cyanobacterium CCP5]